MSTVEVPFEIEGNSIVIPLKINGVETVAILDTGDAVGPVMSAADAQRCHVRAESAMQVSGAGGAASAYTAHMRVNLGGVVFFHEAGAIDQNLQGPSLLGLPFFLAKASVLAFDFDAGVLAFTLKDSVTGGEATVSPPQAA